jgi:hypothetical protein
MLGGYIRNLADHAEISETRDLTVLVYRNRGSPGEELGRAQAS